MIEKLKENSGRQKKTSEWSTTLMNDLGFNLYVAPQSPVMRLDAYFRVEGKCQNKGSKEVE